MVHLYFYEACFKGNHSKCDLTQPAPPGVFGGSKCYCNCNGNSLWTVNQTKTLLNLDEKFIPIEKPSETV